MQTLGGHQKHLENIFENIKYLMPISGNPFARVEVNGKNTWFNKIISPADVITSRFSYHWWGVREACHRANRAGCWLFKALHARAPMCSPCAATESPDCQNFTGRNTCLIIPWLSKAGDDQPLAVCLLDLSSMWLTQAFPWGRGREQKNWQWTLKWILF